jgi:transposase
MRRGPRSYSEEFRREAVRLAESGEKPVAQIARELGISARSLRSWQRRFAKAASRGSPTALPLLEAEIRRLRRENARLLEEGVILKKATAFFAKDAR